MVGEISAEVTAIAVAITFRDEAEISTLGAGSKLKSTASEAAVRASRRNYSMSLRWIFTRYVDRHVSVEFGVVRLPDSVEKD